MGWISACHTVGTLSCWAGVWEGLFSRFAITTLCFASPATFPSIYEKSGCAFCIYGIIGSISYIACVHQKCLCRTCWIVNVIPTLTSCNVSHRHCRKVITGFQSPALQKLWQCSKYLSYVVHRGLAAGYRYKATIVIAARMAITTITIRSSTIVKPRVDWISCHHH